MDWIENVPGRSLQLSLGLWLILAAILACNSGPTGAAAQPSQHFAEIRETFAYSDRYGSEFRISYLDTGPAVDAAIVLIHGFGASVYTWNALIPELARERRIIALDLKGFGASDKPDDGHYSVFDQAEVVDALIRHLGLRDVILGGHSMGGTVAVVLASDRPDDRPYGISRLMIFDAPLFRQRLPLFIMALDIPFLGEAGLHLIPPATAVRWVLKESYYNDELIEEEEVDAYAAGLSDSGGRRALARTAGALADLNGSRYMFDFDEIDVPVLIIWGKNDKVVPRGYAYALRDALPGPVSFHMLDKCGHFPPTERSEEVSRLIREFLTLN